MSPLLLKKLIIILLFGLKSELDIEVLPCFSFSVNMYFESAIVTLVCEIQLCFVYFEGAIVTWPSVESPWIQWTVPS